MKFFVLKYLASYPENGDHQQLVYYCQKLQKLKTVTYPYSHYFTNLIYINSSHP